MERPVLKAESRTAAGTRAVRKVRAEGKIPAVVCASKAASTSIQVGTIDFATIMKAKARIVDLDVAGAKETVLIKEVQYDHLGEEVLHVDFNKIRMDVKLKIEVPVEVEGTPVGIKEGGVLMQDLHKIRVECLPADIPEKIKIDVSLLELGKAIHVRDLVLPKGVTADVLPELVVAAVRLPKIEEAPAPVAELGATEPELIGKKPEEGEEEAEEGAAPGKEKAAEKKAPEKKAPEKKEKGGKD